MLNPRQDETHLVPRLQKEHGGSSWGLGLGKGLEQSLG